MSDPTQVEKLHNPGGTCGIHGSTSVVWFQEDTTSETGWSYYCDGGGSRFGGCYFQIPKSRMDFLRLIEKLLLSP